MKKIKELLSAIKSWKYYNLVVILFLLGISLVQYYTLEIGYSRDINHIVLRFIPYQIAGVVIILLVNSLLVLAIGRLQPAMVVSSVFTTVWAVANHYTTILHGTPFNILLLKNAATAMNVISNYVIEIDIQVVEIIVLFAAQLFFIFALFGKIRVKRLISLPLTAVFVLAVCVFYIIPGSYIPQNAVSWSWSEAIGKYGYTPCFASNAVRSMNVPEKPESYDEAALSAFAEQYDNTVEGTAQPDIIVILNETFYDLRQVMDIDADCDYLGYINSLENAVTGYAVVPNAGGGTNRSEYELLTSNSVTNNLDITPFNDLEIEGTNSVVSYLKNKGYSTLGAHSYNRQNYRRSTAYPGLGFDEVYFDDDFIDTEFYYNRHYVTDESVYKNLLRWYEEMPEGPKMMYLLTIQNHAAYNHDEAEHDIVHICNDYGEKTEEINEYLTSIYLSDQAFGALVDYYRDSDRDVIICMVGDHAPAFANDYIDESYSETEANLRIRSTPYVIWSNNIDITQEKGKHDIMSINYLLPTVMEMAGMDLSGYYRYLVDMKDEVPVLASYGMYHTANGEVYSYNDETKYTEMIERYYDLCYSNMKNMEFMDGFAN